MTRLFIGAIATESNTFSPVPTTLADFEKGGLFHGTATQSPPLHFTAPLHLWRERAEADGVEVVEGLTATAQPGGITLTPVWHRLRDRLIADVRAAGPLDIILLNLHGAMIETDEFDCEGALLEAVRDLCPKAVIGCELDPHCHLTPRMMQAADLIVAYKEYPHTDIVERAEDLWSLALRTCRKEIHPVGAVAECHMLSVWHTTKSPMRDFVARMHALEATGAALSVSFCHGFALGDMPDLGARMLVYTDGTRHEAAQLAEALAQEIWEMRHQTRTRMMGAAEAVLSALNAPNGPVVIADVADNPGVGAGADSTWLLSALIDAGAKGAVIGLMFDPMAVETCIGAGEGSEMTLRIGGKFSPRSGPPLDLEIRVIRVVTDLQQTTVAGQRTACGRAVLVETAGGIRIAMTDRRVQIFNPDAFTGLGLDLAEAPVVVVKSTQHFHAGFAPVAARILYARSATAVQYEGPENPYKHRDGNYWPLSDQPFREG